MVVTKWTPEEDQFLIENYPLLGGKKTVEQLNSKFGNNRTLGAVRRHAFELHDRKGYERIKVDRKIVKNIRKQALEKVRKDNPRLWSPEEDQFLLENYPVLGGIKTLEELNKKFGKDRTIASLRAHRRDLHVRAGVELVYVNAERKKVISEENGKRLIRQGNAQEWTAEEDQFLIENYPDLGARRCSAQILKKFGKERSAKSIYSRIKDLYNKGIISNVIHVSEKRYAEAKCENGNHDHSPIGTIVERQRGILFIKYKSGADGWMPLRRYIVGDEASDKVVIHLNNDKSDCRPENLACIDRTVMMRLNRYHLLSENAEITKTSIMLCELMKAMQQQEKEN